MIVEKSSLSNLI